MTAHPAVSMNDLNLLKGGVLVAIALAFGLQSLRYPLGTFSRMGPGMFPLLMSCLLLLIGVAMLVRSRLVKRVPIVFRSRNIALILTSLCGFALISEYLNMIAGIAFMVFCASLAGTSYSVARNLKIAAGLVAVAFAFQKLLGLQLPLY